MPKGFYAEAGLQPGFVLSAKDKFEGQTEDVKDDYKTFDLGVPLGVGYNINENASIGIRATPGLINAYKETYTSRHFAAGIRLSYSF